jgi:hypothetical protein
MEGLSPQARFELLSEVVGLDESSIDHVRHSIRHLLPQMSDLIRTLHGALQRKATARVLGDLDPAAREHLQSLFASFVMRTISCNFDEDFCTYAHEVSHNDAVPPRLFPLALAMAGEFVSRTLPPAVDDPDRLASMLAAWDKLLAVLGELTR